MARSRRGNDYREIPRVFLFHVSCVTIIPRCLSSPRPCHYPLELGSLTVTIANRKESHITTFVHLLLASGLPFTNVRIPELDYCSHVTIELWEKSSGNASDRRQKDFSIRLSISEGAHSPAVLDSNVDAVGGSFT